MNLWDRWDVKLESGRNINLNELMEHLEKTYSLLVRDVMRGNAPLFFHTIMNTPGKEKEKEDILNSKIVDLVNAEVTSKE